MLFVQVYGIYIYNFSDLSTVVPVVAQTSEAVQQAVKSDLFTLSGNLQGLFSTFKDVLPIILTIFFFQYFIIRKIIPLKTLRPILI